MLKWNDCVISEYSNCKCAMLYILDLYPMNIGGWNSPGEVIKDDVLTPFLYDIGMVCVKCVFWYYGQLFHVYFRLQNFHFLRDFKVKLSFQHSVN